MNLESTDNKLDPEEPKKYVHRESHNLSSYNKRLILGRLEDYGACPPNCHDISCRFKVQHSVLSGYLNEQARKSQKYVVEECNDSISFLHIKEWIEFLKEKFNVEQTLYEPAYAMKIISKVEEHPDPGEVNGVNFREIYDFIGETMFGHPTKAITGPTRDFLCELFAELIEEVNGEEGDKHSQALREVIRKKLMVVRAEDDYIFNSIDPFNLAYELQ